MHVFAWFSRRYIDLLGSIYIYNEHRGYTALDGLLGAVRSRWPENHALIADIAKHRADERKHYMMFRRWFERRGHMPLFVDRTCGHIDRFVEIMFGRRIDDVDRRMVVDDPRQFEKLCRVISLTEKRGYRQVEILLNHPIVRKDSGLMKIFRIIEQDEPSHWAPYDRWLKENGRPEPKWWERAVDALIHSELLLLKLPILFLNPRLGRRRDWADADEEDPRSPRFRSARTEGRRRVAQLQPH
jgi:hypothetical protein